jgi:hypothetical protein
LATLYGFPFGFSFLSAASVSISASKRQQNTANPKTGCFARLFSMKSVSSALKMSSQAPNSLTVFARAPEFKPPAYRQTYRQSGFHAQFGVGWPERGQSGKYRNFNKLRLAQTSSRQSELENRYSHSIVPGGFDVTS